MTRGRLLLFFITAGLILAVILGIYFYRSNLGTDQDEVTALLQDYVEKISSGDCESARQMMTEETRNLLRDPGTILGETIYRELKLKSVEKIYAEGNGRYAADVILTVPDSLKIMTKAGILFGEKVAEEGPVDDPDQVIGDIYEQILSRDDIPMLDNFLVVRLVKQNHGLLIDGDLSLQQVLEGNIGAGSSVLDALSGQ